MKKTNEISIKDTNFCALGVDHKCLLNVNNGYCAARSCQYQVKQKENSKEKWVCIGRNWICENK